MTWYTLTYHQQHTHVAGKPLKVGLRRKSANQSQTETENQTVVLSSNVSTGNVKFLNLLKNVHREGFELDIVAIWIRPWMVDFETKDTEIKDWVFQTGLQGASTRICLCMSAMMPKASNFLSKNPPLEKHSQLSLESYQLVRWWAACQSWWSWRADPRIVSWGIWRWKSVHQNRHVGSGQFIRDG